MKLSAAFPLFSEIYGTFTVAYIINTV
jgi:hypothetical protein